MELLKGLTTPKVRFRNEVPGLRGLVSDELFLCSPNRNINYPRIAFMASLPSTPIKPRGEVDTSKPYADVREAIQRFDHIPEALKNSAEKRVYESPVVGSLKEQLAEAVAAKEKAEHDKELIQEELAGLRAQLLKPGGDDRPEVIIQALADSRKKVELLESEIVASNVETEKALKKAGLAESSVMGILATVENAAALHEENEARNRTEVEGLRTEVASLSDRIPELQAELERLGKEADDSKAAEARALASLGEASAKLRELEARLKVSEDERNALQATQRYLEPELESARAELQALKDQGEEGEEKYREKIKAAEASEVRNRELEARLLGAFEQVFAEEIEAKLVKDAVNGEIEITRGETAALRLQGEAAEKRAGEVLEEVEAAKAREKSALEAIKGLAVAGDGELETIHQVEDSTRRRIEEADAEAEAARAREIELKHRLEDARAEIEPSKALVKQANDKAASAEAAKSAVEGELRRWRSDNEQRRKLAFQALAGAPPAAAPAHPVLPPHERNGVLDESKESGEKIVEKELEKPKVIGGDERRLSTSDKRLQGESLAEVLQMNLPAKLEQNAKQKKKLKLLARLGAVFTPKKKQPSA